MFKCKACSAVLLCKVESTSDICHILSHSFSFCPPQEACLQGNLIANCLEQLSDPHPLLRQWVAICLGRIWQNFDPARWCGVRDSAHEKLYTLLSDPIPEVRRSHHNLGLSSKVHGDENQWKKNFKFLNVHTVAAD